MQKIEKYKGVLKKNSPQKLKDVCSESTFTNFLNNSMILGHEVSKVLNFWFFQYFSKFVLNLTF